MARREPKLRDTRERLLEAALACFGEKGVAATSVEEIAERAGVTKGAFYYYFVDKHDVARDLQRRLWQRVAAKAAEAVDPRRDTVANLQHAFEAHLAALRDLGEARFFLREGWRLPALGPAGRREQDEAAALVRDLLARGVQRGEVVACDLDALAAIVTGLFEEATLHVLTTDDARPATEVVHLLLGALAPAHERGERTMTPR